MPKLKVQTTPEQLVDQMRQDPELRDSVIAFSTYMEQAGKISPLPRTVEDRIRIRLNQEEGVLNRLFSKSIALNHQFVSPAIRFLSTPDFFDQVIYPDNISPNPRQLMQLLLTSFETMGLRHAEGKKIAVHTTTVNKDMKFRQISEEEAYYIAKHEMVHGKVEPIYGINDFGEKTRTTGCKVIVYDENGSVKRVGHSRLYEAQTDILTLIASHPELTSFSQIFHLFIAEKAGNSDQYGYAMSALCRIMDYVFPDFQQGLQFLGEHYFTSSGVQFLA